MIDWFHTDFVHNFIVFDHKNCCKPNIFVHIFVVIVHNVDVFVYNLSGRMTSFFFMFDGNTRRVCFPANYDGKTHWEAVCIDVENYQVIIACPMGATVRQDTKETIEWFIQHHARTHKHATAHFDVVEVALDTLLSPENQTVRWKDNGTRVLPTQTDSFNCAVWVVWYIMYFMLGMVPFSDVPDWRSLYDWQEKMRDWLCVIVLTDGRVVAPLGWTTKQGDEGGNATAAVDLPPAAWNALPDGRAWKSIFLNAPVDIAHYSDVQHHARQLPIVLKLPGTDNVTAAAAGSGDDIATQA